MVRSLKLCARPRITDLCLFPGWRASYNKLLFDQIMSQARKRVRITPQKGINQVTQTSFGLDECLHPVSEHTSCPHQPFLDSPLCSTLKDGHKKPMGLGIEQMSEITLPDNHQNSDHHFASFLVSDDCLDDDKENVHDDEEDNGISDNYNTLEQRGSAKTASVKRNGFPVRVQLLESTQECDESDTSFEAICTERSLPSNRNQDPTSVAPAEVRLIPGGSSASASTTSLVPLDEVSRGVIFTRLKRKLTMSLSESKEHMSLSNTNTPVKERSQVQMEALPLEDKQYGVCARKILRLRNAVATAFDNVAPKIRTGLSFLYTTEEFIARLRQNVLKSVREREREEENLCESTFGSEMEYLTANNSILPRANENNQCAICGTDSLSLLDFSNHKNKHILKANKTHPLPISHSTNLTS